MKKHLLPQSGKFYKANLHMHTTVSDGNMTPEETKTAYKNRGYSIVAFTDHEIVVPHPELNDEDFLAITAAEIAVNKPGEGSGEFIKTYHFNLYALDPANVRMPCFTESAIWFEHEKYVTDEMRKTNFKRTFTADCVNTVIRQAREAEFLVSYNHPVWSLNSYADYAPFKGLWGVECYNNGCRLVGYPDTVQPFEDLLRLNERVFPLATDDAHSQRDCFGGFVMIRAEKLEYSAVMSALQRGAFYASTGPEIHSLWMEDGVLHCECSEATEIILNTERRYACRCAANGKPLTSAQWDLTRFSEESKRYSCDGSLPYVRVTVKDARGGEAHTRAYFTDEL